MIARQRAAPRVLEPPGPLEHRVVVNGSVHELRARPDETLLEVLREGLGLTGTKGSCGRGECGACTVLVSGEPVLSCVSLVSLVEGVVTTVEGLEEESSDLRARLADLGGFQCGYCTSGMVVVGTALLRAGNAGSDQEVRRAISGNLCRCTGYDAIVGAIRDVATARDRERPA